MLLVWGPRFEAWQCGGFQSEVAIFRGSFGCHNWYLMSWLGYFFFKIFVWLCCVLVVAFKLLVVACGIQFPDQGLIPSSLYWECGVLVTGPPGKSPGILLNNLTMQRIIPTTKDYPAQNVNSAETEKFWFRERVFRSHIWESGLEWFWGKIATGWSCTRAQV